MYVKKSPGWEKRGEDVSSLLPYVYTDIVSLSLVPQILWSLQKYVSKIIPKSGPVIKNDENSLHNCGGNL